MTKSKHTPGPWRTVMVGTASHDVVTGSERLGALLSKADARLIAAAPDLLAALERLAAAVPGHIMGADFDYGAMDDARAAIARARGDK